MAYRTTQRNCAIFFLIALLLLSCLGCKESLSNGQVADQTVAQVLQFVAAQDSSGLLQFFAPNVQTATPELRDQITAFFTFLQGPVVSVSPAEDSGVGGISTVQNQKVHREIDSAFCLTTNQKTYYIAMLECVRDDADMGNVGLLSLYVIDAENWNRDYVYRGDGRWTPGINVVNEPQ